MATPNPTTDATSGVSGPGSVGANTALSSGPTSSLQSQLVDEFESSFMNCISLLTSQDHINIQDSDETKGSVENSVQKFVESARQMENFFLNKRLVLSIAKPEHVLNEDVNELRAELERKDKLLEKHQEKLAKWQALLRSNLSPATSGPASPFPSAAPPTLPPGTSMQQPGMQGPPVTGGPPPGPMLAPGQYPGPPPGHPAGAPLGPYMPPPAYHQAPAPLAYLERM